jgi:hypothetical protein
MTKDDEALLERVRHELWQIQMEMHQAFLREQVSVKAELKRNMKLDRHSMKSFTNRQIAFAEQLLGIG